MVKTNKAQKILTIIITIIVCISAIVIVYEFMRIANLKSTKQKLESTLDGIQQQIYEYNDKNAYYSDRDNFLEEYAREQYNWGKSGRTYFEV